MNISANLLGMSGAATPLGIKAIESMQKDNQNKLILNEHIKKTKRDFKDT